jgi:hypothetical protein
MYIFRPPYTEQFVYTTIALVGWLLRLVDTQKAYSKYHVTLRDLGMQKIEAIRFVPDLHTVTLSIVWRDKTFVLKEAEKNWIANILI